MANNHTKNSISVFFKDQADIIALVLIVVLAAAGLIFHYRFLVTASLFIALINFVRIYFGTREKQDERTQHHRNLAGYHTVIAIFLLVAIISVLYRYNVIRNLDIQYYSRIITWSIGFIYTAAYSIIKRQQ